MPHPLDFPGTVPTRQEELLERYITGKMYSDSIPQEPIYRLDGTRVDGDYYTDAGNRMRQNAATNMNQQRIAQWAGRPVKAQNKAMKNEYFENQGAGYYPGSSYESPRDVRMGREMNNYHDSRFRPEPTGKIATKAGNVVTRMAGPVGRLPAIAAPLGVASGVTGALNMPEAYQNFLRFANQYGLMNGMQRYITGDTSQPEL